MFLFNIINLLGGFSGLTNYNATTNTVSLPDKYSIAAPTVDLELGADVLPAPGGCIDGVWAFDEATMYLTNNGGAVVHIFGDDLVSEDDDAFIFALKQKAISNVNAMDGSFVGMLFDETGSVGDKVIPIGLTCVSGACIGGNVTDINTGAIDATSTVTVSLNGTVDTPNTGIITGTISTDTSEGNMTCMIDIDVSGTGKKIGSCVGQAPDDSTKMFNVIFVSVD